MITKKDLEMQIEMLVKDDQHSQETIVRQAQEIERLNNIINELEKYIGQEWYCFDNESVEYEVAKNILDKLKELKQKEIDTKLAKWLLYFGK